MKRALPLTLLMTFVTSCELIVKFDPPPELGVQCDDGLDNDDDGAIDCADDGCAGSAGCAAPETGAQCDDGLDNDGDTLTDCADPGCADFAGCQGPRCGDGTVDPPNPRFATAIDVDVPGAQAVAAGDLDGDGRTDLLVAQANGSVTVVRNTGTGFTAGSPVSVGGLLVAVALGDLDQDGDLDAVVADQPNAHIVVLENDGGTFTPGTPVAVEQQPRGIVLFDFDRDGDLDVAVADGVAGQISAGTVLTNAGGTLTFPQTLSDAGPVAALAAGDVNGDERLDLVAVNTTSSFVRPYFNFDFSGTIFFSEGPTTDTTMPTALVVSDLDGNGRADAVVGSATSGSLAVFLVDIEGILGSGSSVPVPGATSVTGLAAGDFNRDGHDDLVVATGARLVLLLGNGDGGFTAGTEVTASANAGAPVTFHEGGDVRLDVAAPLSSEKVTVALGNGEECDDGNTDPGDACRPDCTFPGTPLWARGIGGAMDDFVTDVAVDDRDNVYVAGRFQGTLNIAGATPITSQGGYDFFVASFSPDGNLRWRATYGGKGDDVALALAVGPFGQLVVGGQSGLALYGDFNVQFDDTAFVVQLSPLDGSVFGLITFTTRSSTGRVSSLAFQPDGLIRAGGRFDGMIDGLGFQGPAAFVATNQGEFTPFSGSDSNEIISLRRLGQVVTGLLTFAGTVPQLDLVGDGMRDQALLVFGARVGPLVQHFGGSGDVTSGDIAVCLPQGLWVVNGFSGQLEVGSQTLTAQGPFDPALILVAQGGSVSVVPIPAPGGESAQAAVCSPQQDVVAGGSFQLFGAPAAIGAFAQDGTPLWSIPAGIVPARMARDSRGFVYVAGGFSGALTWGSDNLSPLGGQDGILAKLRP